MKKVKHKFMKRFSNPNELYSKNFVAFKVTGFDGKSYGQLLEYTNEDSYVSVLRKLVRIKHRTVKTKLKE